jgi:hypothetical protein
VFEGSVPNERPSVEQETGDPVAEVLDGARGCGADSRTKVAQGASGRSWRSRQVGAHLRRGTTGVSG